MKIRNGFVSNSSSSSFIIIGYKIPCDTNYSLIQNITESGDDDNLLYIEKEDCEYIIGKVIASWTDEDYLHYETIEESDRLEGYEIAKKYFPNIIASDIKIIMGTRPC